MMNILEGRAKTPGQVPLGETVDLDWSIPSERVLQPLPLEALPPLTAVAEPTAEKSVARTPLEPKTAVAVADW